MTSKSILLFKTYIDYICFCHLAGFFLVHCYISFHFSSFSAVFPAHIWCFNHSVTLEKTLVWTNFPSLIIVVFPSRLLTVCIIPSRCAIVSSLLEGPYPQPALPALGPAKALLRGWWRRRRGRWQWRALPHGRFSGHPVLQPLQPWRAPPAVTWPGRPPRQPRPQQRCRARRQDPISAAGRGGAAGPTAEGGAERAWWGGLRLPQPWWRRTGHQALRGSGLSLLLHVLLWDVLVTRRGWRHPLQGLWEHSVPGGGGGQRSGVPTRLRPTQEGLRRSLLWGRVPRWGGWRGGGEGRRSKQPMSPLLSHQCLIPPRSLEGSLFCNKFPTPPWRLKFEPARMLISFDLNIRLCLTCSISTPTPHPVTAFVPIRCIDSIFFEGVQTIFYISVKTGQLDAAVTYSWVWHSQFSAPSPPARRLQKLDATNRETEWLSSRLWLIFACVLQVLKLMGWPGLEHGL